MNPVHVFWDNSNIWLGAVQSCINSENPEYRYALRLSFRNLDALVVKNRTAITKILCGSVPPECEDLWEHAKKLQYNTQLLKRVQTGTRMEEQAVDELLHLGIANAILDNAPPQTLIILSGDGKTTSTGTSFVKQAERALRHGWCVEIYAWAGTISAAFNVLASRYTDKMIVYTLNGYYNQLTYLEGGDYYIEGKTVHVSNRVVQKLP